MYRSHWRRFFVPLSHAGIVALVATGWACGRSGATARTTIDFWAFGREGEVVQQLIPEFERANPGIHVRVQEIPWTAAHEKLLTAYVGRTLPDIAQLGNTWIPEFTALGALHPLDSLVDGSTAVRPGDFFPGIWATNVIDGHVYGIPWYVDTRVLFYRTDILARAGYDSPPRTWTEWRKAMLAIQRIIGRPVSHAIFLPTDEWAQPVILGMQAGSSLLRDGGRYGDFEGPAFRKAFEFYIGMFRDSLAPVIGNAQMANLYQEFARGTFAMYITGPWNIGEFKRRLPRYMEGRWSTAPLPSPDSLYPGTSLAGGSSLVLFNSSRHSAEAWKLVEYLTSARTEVEFYKASGDLPPRPAAWRDGSLAQNRYARAFYTQLQNVTPAPKVPEWEQITMQVINRAESAIRGQASVAEALAGLDSDVNAILEKRRWMLDRRGARERGTHR